jgi:hypothetical protein
MLCRAESCPLVDVAAGRDESRRFLPMLFTRVERALSSCIHTP